MISFRTSGSFSNMERYLTRAQKLDVRRVLERLGQEGVNALASATPARSGLAGNSWTYEVSYSGGSATITWRNMNVENGFNVAIGIQYGHGTGTGGYVSGQDYINPAMRPIFDRISDEIGKAVRNA